jgi:hypothetical protein
MQDSIEGENALASFTDEHSTESFRGDNSTGKSEAKEKLELRISQTPRENMSYPFVLQRMSSITQEARFLTGLVAVLVP